MDNTTGNAIDGFWAWFQRNEKALENLYPGNPAWDELDRQLAAIGADGWEIGPDLSDKTGRFFALSVRGDRERYGRNKCLVASAPTISGWHFYPARPRKAWNRIFVWSEKQAIDATRWTFLLYGYPDGMFDIVLLGNQLPGFDSGEQRRILAFVIESELGEALAIEKVNSLEIDENPRSDESKMSIEISRLFEFLMNQRLQ